MAKDPAFLFYPGDFSTGTQFFTDEQVGKYIRLLMAQHQLGHLEENHMIHICKSYDKHIFSKFVKDSEGKYFNERLEHETIKRKKYSESRSKNRLTEKIICQSYDPHMENKIINKDSTIVSNSLWTEILKTFSNDFIWKEKFCRDKNILPAEYELKKSQFLSDLDLKEDFKDLKELKSHFVNWFNIKKNGTYNSTRNNGKDAGALQTLQDIKDGQLFEYPGGKENL